MSKQYGLILPNKNEKAAPIFQATRNVFGDDSESDEEQGKKKPTLRPTDKIKKQVKIAQEKAVSEDPTVYQYDELYDDMELKKKENKSAIKEDKKPKYIEKLMQTANKRKRENERRQERQVQKEREKEDGEFADKESFVTSAYKEKLEELRAEEEKEKREEYLENIGDVTKQKDLGGFYRHLYEQKLGDEPKVKEIKTTPKKEHNADVKSKNIHSEQVENRSERNMTPVSSSPRIKNRNYRKRKVSADLGMRELSEGEIVSEEDDKVPTLQDIRAHKKARNDPALNIDADSDFSMDSSDSEPPVKNIKVTEHDNEIRDEKSKPLEKASSKVTMEKSQDIKDKPQDKKEKLKDKTDQTQNKINKPLDKKQKSDKQAEVKDKPEKQREPAQDVFKSPIQTSKEKVEKRADKIKSLSPAPLTQDLEEKSPLTPKVNIWEKRTVGVVFEEALKRYYERKAARSQ